MTKTVLTAALLIGLLRFTDINEDIICPIEANHIKNEVENAQKQYEEGMINLTQFDKIIAFNQLKLDDLLIA